jgi:Na+/H+ antiporter NhaC
MPEDTYGWLSLLPPLAAILLAVTTRRVVLSLLLGTAIGACILNHGHPTLAVASLLTEHLWSSLVNEDHVRVFAFTLLMGAMVGVIHRSGGMHGVVGALSPLARNRRSGQVTTWCLGLVVFFDDYANTLLLGGTMRPLADRLKISREKLAYLVDSTAAPVAGLALVSTWVAGEIGFIKEGFAGLPLDGVTVDGFAVFVATIPYRFYVLWALAFVPLVALLGRDFGPMLAAERRASGQTDGLHSGDKRPLTHLPEPDRDSPRRWHVAVVPVVVLLGVTGWLLVETGAARLAAEGQAEASWLTRFGNGDSYVALVYGSLSGLLTAVGWSRLQGDLGWRQIGAAALKGASQMWKALVILWLAWSLSAMTGKEHLGTGVYVGNLLQQSTSAAWLPTIVFVLASAVAFATGTSWGTMGILMPLVIRVSYQVLSAGDIPVGPNEPLLLATIGSVLAGAIFGDHCSPISDTTVLSSQASGCDHVAHVRTQLPYALLVGGVSIGLGTLPVGFGVNVWPLLPLGVILLAVCVRVLGRPV